MSIYRFPSAHHPVADFRKFRLLGEPPRASAAHGPSHRVELRLAYVVRQDCSLRCCAAADLIGDFRLDCKSSGPELRTRRLVRRASRSSAGPGNRADGNVPPPSCRCQSPHRGGRRHVPFRLLGARSGPWSCSIFHDIPGRGTKDPIRPMAASTPARMDAACANPSPARRPRGAAAPATHSGSDCRTGAAVQEGTVHGGAREKGGDYDHVRVWRGRSRSGRLSDDERDL